MDIAILNRDAGHVPALSIELNAMLRGVAALKPVDGYVGD